MPMSKEQIKQRYWRRIGAGNCGACGKYPVRPGLTSCERCSERYKAWSKKNSELLNKKRVEWVDKNRDRYREQHRIHAAKVYHAKREKGLCIRCGLVPPRDGRIECADCQVKNSVIRRGYATRKHQKRRAIVLAGYGGTCACCRESTPQFLTLDHVNNDGAAHRKELNNGDTRNNARVYDDAIRRGFPSDLQLLCWNCNCAKAFYGECPHRESVHSAM